MPKWRISNSNTLDIYPLNYDQIKDRGDYLTLQESKYFNMHEPLFGEKLVEELSKYDYGIYIFELDKKQNKKLLSTAFGNKVSTYLESTWLEHSNLLDFPVLFGTIRI